MEEYPCLQCTEIIPATKDCPEPKWCNMDCKKDFYKKHFKGLGTVCEQEIEEEKRKWRESPEGIQFNKRCIAIGIRNALLELGDLKIRRKIFQDDP